MLEGPPPPPLGRRWFGADGNKLVTAAWRRYGVDTPATRNEADWIFHTEPTASHHLQNYPTIEPHRAAMGQYFDQLLAAGMTEEYNLDVHGSREDFAAVINPLHVVLKGAGESGQ